MHRLKSIFIVLVSGLWMTACSKSNSFEFRKSQSETILELRKDGYLEYSTPFNAQAQSVLDATVFPKILSENDRREIDKIAEALSESEFPMSCFRKSAHHMGDNQHIDYVIVMDQNPEHGTIIRFFSRDEKFIQLFPNQSF
ncbi:hypothetical protein [Flavobacterium sp.]|uniref:hypothetical protein n=1 Tax=Flavobacterium sp. TaxID=239 RepID=UPI0039E4FE11